MGKENFFIIPNRLPSLNEYINACRRNKYTGAKMKQESEELVKWAIRLHKAKGNLTNVAGSFIVDFEWSERTRKRDPDNVSAFGKKVILDALQVTGVIQNDSPKYVKGFSDKFIYSLNKNFIKVTIISKDD